MASLRAARDALAARPSLLLCLGAYSVFNLAVFSVGIYVRSMQYREMREKAAPQGSLGVPIFGELGPFFFSPIRYRLKRLIKYGRSFTSHLLFRPTVVAVGVADNDAVLKGEVKGFTLVNWPSHFQRLMGPNALTVVTGNKHRLLRKILAKSLTPEACKAYQSSIDRISLNALEAMANCTKPVSSRVYKKVALEIFFRAAFGEGITDREIDEILILFNVWLDGFIAMIPLELPFLALGKAMQARTKLLRTIADLVARYKQAHPEETPTVFGRVVYAKDEDGNALTAEEVLDNLLTLCFAGHDTTFATLSTLTAMLFNPENKHILAKLRKEVHDTFGCDLSTPLDYEKLRNAPYLQAVLDENWRVNNPVGFGFREAITDFALPSGAGVVPAGWAVEYDITIAARNPAVWERSDVFDPERFMPSMPANLAQHFLLFGGGNRICLGMNLAYLEVKVFVIRLMQGFDVKVLKQWEDPLPVMKIACEFELRRTAA